MTTQEVIETPSQEIRNLAEAVRSLIEAGRYNGEAGREATHLLAVIKRLRQDFWPAEGAERSTA